MDNEERTLGLDTEEVVETEEETETPEEEKTEETDDVETLKEKAKKAEEERDRYKQDLLALKNSRKAAKKSPPTDGIEAKIESVLHKQNERAVLKRVIDEKSEMYIPELVDGKQYLEIIGYLPRNIDRSTPEGIHKALKQATSLWKAESGKGGEVKKDVAADIAGTQTKPGGSKAAPAAKPTVQRIRQPFAKWYEKPQH
jgi:hypothetical protein